MHTATHSAFPPVPAGVLQNIAGAICDRPNDTAVQRAVRFLVVAETVQGFQPRDTVEAMLAGMAVTHAHLVEDSARDVFRGQDDRLKARTKSTIVALGRGMFGFLKELRTIQSQRQEAAVAIGTAADTTENAAPVPVGPLDTAPANAAAPKIRITAVDPKADARSQDQFVPRLPPLRRAETSVAAMMAALSPMLPTYKISRAADQSVPAPPVAGRATSPASKNSAGEAAALAA